MEENWVIEVFYASKGSIIDGAIKMEEIGVTSDDINNLPLESVKSAHEKYIEAHEKAGIRVEEDLDKFRAILTENLIGALELVPHLHYYK